MSVIDFYGDVHWENKTPFIISDEPYVFNFEYIIETEDATPAINKIIVTGSGDFESWNTLPLAVSLANNHIMDLGDAGLEHTTDILDQNGINWFGVGTKEDNFHNPCIVTIADKRIAFLGYSDYEFLLEMTNHSYNCACPTNEQIAYDMGLCKNKNVDAIIVNIHWGREERSWYNSRQETIAHYLIDQGADLIIGHHPHCIQPFEIYQGKYIFYSLGNTYFPNLCTPSYYDALGKSEFYACVRNLRCGRKSLRVRFDVSTNEVVEIREMKFKKGALQDLNIVRSQKIVCEILKINFVNEFVGYFRRMLILIKSNICVKGEFINIKALKKEFAFLNARQNHKSESF